MKNLLWVDGLAGLAAGIAFLVLVGPMSWLYELPRSLLLAMAAANLLYGAFSITLASRRRRPVAWVIALAAANASWAIVCLVLAAFWWGAASVFGIIHLVLEAVFVGGLAMLEWRWRRLLAA